MEKEKNLRNFQKENDICLKVIKDMDFEELVRFYIEAKTGNDSDVIIDQFPVKTLNLIEDLGEAINEIVEE